MFGFDFEVIIKTLLTVLIALGICGACFIICACNLSAQESRREERREIEMAIKKAEEEELREEIRAEILKEMEDK